MKYFLLISVMFVSHICFSQHNLETFWNNRCDYKTDGSGKSLGLKIKLSVPCSWSKEDGERPHVVKKFSFTEDGATASMNMTIVKSETIPTKSEINETISEKGLKLIAQQYGTFVSARKIKIDGLDCGEVIYKINRETTIGALYSYVIQYLCFYKDKSVTLSYYVGTGNEKTANSLFEKYKVLFRGLAGQTVFLSKWE